MVRSQLSGVESQVRCVHHVGARIRRARSGLNGRINREPTRIAISGKCRAAACRPLVAAKVVGGLLLWAESRMGLWVSTCRRLTFNKQGASTTRRSSSSRTASVSGTASTSPTRTRPQRSSARVVKSRGEPAPRNTPRPKDAAGDGSVEEGRPAAALPRWPTASPGQRGRFARPRSAQYLLGALQLKVEASCWLLRLPHFGQAGGRFFRRACSVIAMLISKRLPQDWHSNS